MEEIIIKFNNFAMSLLISVFLISISHIFFNFTLGSYANRNFPVFHDHNDLIDAYKENPNFFSNDKYKIIGNIPYYIFYYFPGSYCLIQTSGNDYPGAQMVIENENPICEGTFGAGTGVAGYGYSLAFILNCIIFGVLFFIARYYNWENMKNISRNIFLLYLIAIVYVFLFWRRFASSWGGPL